MLDLIVFCNFMSRDNLDVIAFTTYNFLILNRLFSCAVWEDFVQLTCSLEALAHRV